MSDTKNEVPCPKCSGPCERILHHGTINDKPHIQYSYRSLHKEKMAAAQRAISEHERLLEQRVTELEAQIDAMLVGGPRTEHDRLKGIITELEAEKKALGVEFSDLHVLIEELRAELQRQSDHFASVLAEKEQMYEDACIEGDVLLEDVNEQTKRITKLEAELKTVQKARVKAEEDAKATFGNPCDKHKDVAAWVGRVKKDDEDLHCFGCFIEYREKQQRLRIWDAMKRRIVKKEPTDER